VITQPASRVDLHFPKAGDDLHGLVSGIPGATCPVPLSFFSSQRMIVDGREVVRIALPSGPLILERDGRTYPLRGGAVTVK